MPPSTQYRITRIVGQGAFGAVYEGERLGEGLKRRVALKLLLAEHLGSENVERRLRDEARMLALIHHRAIVRVDDLIRLDDAWCVVMEYVEGASLGELVKAGPVPPRAAVQIAEEVASALHAAHNQLGPEGNPLRLVHRDIKPDNVRITSQGEVKLLDFGIARADFGEREAKTTDQGMGTLAYVSSERYRGEDTHAGDVYALGVTLFQALTGVLPGASAADADRRPPGRRLRAQWTWLAETEPALQSLVHRMMADDMEDRPTARECARELVEIRVRLDGEPLEDWAAGAIAALGLSSVGKLSVAGSARENSTMLRVGQTIGAAAGPRRQPGTGPVADTSTGTKVLGVAALGVAGIFAIALGVVVAGGVGWWALQRPDAAVAVEIPAVKVEPVVAAPPPIRAEEAPVAAERPEPPATSKAKPSPAGPATKPVPAVATPAAPKLVPAVSKPVAPAPAPIPAPAPKGGTVVTSGASEVRLGGAAGGASAGEVPPGSWSATVTFADGAQIALSGIRVEVGKTTHVRCDAKFAACKISAPE